MELLVALFIILAIAVMGYLFVPGLLGNSRRTAATDQVSQWLLTARQQAKRDGLPTGLRLVLPTDAAGNVVVEPDGSVLVRQLQCVQQPEPLVGGSLTRDGLSGGQCVGVRDGVVSFREVDFVGGGVTSDEYLVQPGDYLELRGGGSVHRIADVTTDQLLLSDRSVNEPGFTPTTAYRILRQPRPLAGEKVLEIPSDAAIDLGPPAAVDPVTRAPLSFQSSSPTRSARVPERLVGGGASPEKLVVEVVFTPAGAVLTPRTGKVILWMRDVKDQTGAAHLIAISVGTGFIAAHDVAPGPNPYTFAEDGRGSGL